MTPEERRQKILASSQARLARIRDANRSETAPNEPPMTVESVPAPDELLARPSEHSSAATRTVINNNQESTAASLFSAIRSIMSMFNSFGSSSTTKTTEASKEVVLMDKQLVFMFVLGIILGILYSFYVSVQSNLFFVVYFSSCVCILTSRYYLMEMKYRPNVLITTAMLSGFKPQFMKKISLVYTLVYDSWTLFAFYFVSFCFTHVFCSFAKMA